MQFYIPKAWSYMGVHTHTQTHTHKTSRGPQVPNKPRVWDIIESQKKGSQVPTCAASPMNRIDSKCNSNASRTESKHSVIDVAARRSYDSIPKGNITATHQEWHDKTGYNPMKTPINNQAGKSVLSQAGANNVLPYEISPSKRSVRTGAFQGVPVK